MADTDQWLLIPHLSNGSVSFVLERELEAVQVSVPVEDLNTMLQADCHSREP